MSHTFEESDHEPTPLFEGNAPPPPRRPWTGAAAFTKMASVIMLAAIVTMAVISWIRTQHDYDKSPAAAQGSEPVSMQAEDEDSACAKTCTMNGKAATCRETMAEVLRQSGQRVVQCGAVQQTVDQECPQCSACPVSGSVDIRQGVQGSYTMMTELWESCKSIRGGLNPCRVQSDPVQQWEAACKRGDWLPGVRVLEAGSGSNLVDPDALAYMVSESFLMRNSSGDIAEIKRFARAPNALAYYLRNSNGTEYKWQTFFDDLDVHCRTGQTTPEQNEFDDVSKLLNSEYCSVKEVGCIASKPWPTVPEYPYYVKKEWMVKQAGWSETEEQSHRTITMYKAPDGTPVMFEIHSGELAHMVMVITEYSPGEDADMPALPSPPCPQVDETKVFPDAIPILNSPYGPCVDASKEILEPRVPKGLANNGLYYDVDGGSPPVQWYDTNNYFPIRRLQSIGGMANESRELVGPSSCQLPVGEVTVPLVGQAKFKGCGPGPLCILPNGVALTVYGKSLESFCLKVCTIEGSIEAGGWVSCDIPGFGGKPACEDCGEIFAKGCLSFSVNPLAALKGTGLDWLLSKLDLFGISLCAGGSIGDASWFRMFIGGSSFVNFIVAQINADTQLTYAAQAKNMKCGHQLLSWNGLTMKIEVGVNLFFARWMKTVLNKKVVDEKCLWSTDMDPKDECAPYADQCGGCKTCSCDDDGCTTVPPAPAPTPPSPPKSTVRSRIKARREKRRKRRR